MHNNVTLKSSIISRRDPIVNKYIRESSNKKKANPGKQDSKDFK